METGDDLTFDERDSAPFTFKSCVIDTGLHLGSERRSGARSWENTIIYEAHVRGFTQQHPAVAGGVARHLCRHGERGDHRLSVSLGVTRRRAAAGPHLRRRQPPARQGAEELLGLQHDRVLRTGAALRGERRLRLCRVQGDGGAPARSRPRGHPRRRLQPHRRGQPARADAVASRASTTPPTTGWRPTRATTSTTPAPATR